jgi:tRNA(adenine34) deaminase
MSNQKDIEFMEIAIQQAFSAAELGEVPVGAVLVKNDQIIAKAGNRPISNSDPTAHAEMLTLRESARKLNNYRILESTLYVTLEPCPMCVGAILHARVARVVFGAADPKTGALVSMYHMGRDGRSNHTLEVTAGILAEQCGNLLKDFFAQRRK